MESDVIMIDNQGNGFREAVEETRKIAEFKGLSHKDSLHLQLFTEEMLSMIHSVTGQVNASFWVACKDQNYELNLTTKTLMDSQKREQLISSTTARKNEAANSFLGMLRDAFEEALTVKLEQTYFEMPSELASDLAGRYIEGPEWDGYERSVLLKLADDVKIAIRGGQVHMTVTKNFGA